MPFEIESTTLIYICAALSVVLFVEAIYLLGFSTASYRGRVNRRLRLMQDGSDSQAVLLQLRRERGLTSTGLYELTQMITEVRLLAQNMNRISIQIERDPARFFFGDRQKGFNAQ